MTDASFFVSPEIQTAQHAALRSHGALTALELEWVEEMAFRYGSAPESYDVARCTESVLFTPDRSGVVNVIPDGKFWHIPGGILAPLERHKQIARWLKQTADSQGKTLALYSIGHQNVAAFRESGYEVSRFGMEPCLDLRNLNWKGGQFQWVRRQANFCERAGVKITEVCSVTEQRQMAATLLSIMRDDLAGRTYAQPLRLLEGQFDPEHLLRRRLFVATKDGRVQAFVACSPLHNGTEWAFETYRKATDSVRGVVPFLFKTVADRMQAEGVARVSLCLVPGKGLQQPDTNDADDSDLVHRMLSMWYRRLNFLFNVQGLDHFKQRFRPEDHVRYVCVSSKSTIRSVLSFARVTGALRPSVKNMLSRMFR